MNSGVATPIGRPLASRLVKLALAASVVAITAGISAAQNRTPGQPPAPRASKASGADILGYGEQFLAIGTRNSRDAAMIFAREYIADFPSISVARFTDGNWAVLVGITDKEFGNSAMRSLKAAGRIPNGAFLVPGDRVDDIVWSQKGSVDNESLQLPNNAPRTPVLASLGITGSWSVSPRGCGNPGNEDLLESEMQIEPRAMRWGSFGKCEFGSIVRVGGGVFLDATCGAGDRKESFVLSLKREGAGIVVVTDPTEKNRLSYQLQACQRPGNVALGPTPQTRPQQQPPRPQAQPNPPQPNQPPRVSNAGLGTDPSNRPPPKPQAPEGKPKSTGSGFFVSSTGHIITNEHVINECSTLVVKGFGTARLVQADQENDLALLKVDPQTPVPFLKVRTEPARLGQDVVVFGYPLASFLDNGLNVTTGIVSSEIGMHNDKRMLQFTAAIQPGNSGGPVVDRTGNLVAVVRSKFSDKFALERGSFVPQNLNYGIKTEVLLRFLGDNGVNAQIANEQKDRTIAELAATARDHTLLVSCH
jgi:S1-C subfamily serine protease